MLLAVHFACLRVDLMLLAVYFVCLTVNLMLPAVHFACLGVDLMLLVVYFACLGVTLMRLVSAFCVYCNGFDAPGSAFYAFGGHVLHARQCIFRVDVVKSILYISVDTAHRHGVIVREGSMHDTIENILERGAHTL